MDDALKTKYAEKVNALLAKAEATTNEHERLAFNEAAERLMIKWGIEEAQLAAAKKGKDAANAADKIDKIVFDWEGIYWEGWESLAAAVVKGLSNSMVIVRYDKPGWRTSNHVIGFRSDLDRATQLIFSLKAQCEDELTRWWKSTGRGKGYTGQERFVMRRQFIFSYGVAVRDRLVKARLEETKTSGAELVLANRDKQVQEYTNALFGGGLRASSGGARRGSHMAAAAGFQAGKRASFHKGQVSS